MAAGFPRHLGQESGRGHPEVARATPLSFIHPVGPISAGGREPKLGPWLGPGGEWYALAWGAGKSGRHIVISWNGADMGIRVDLGWGLGRRVRRERARAGGDNPELRWE